MSQPVGQNAPNQEADVALIQALLNINLPRIPDASFLIEDGKLGQRSQAVLENFQNTVATPGAASGVIEPESTTFQSLRSVVNGALDATVLQIVMPLSTTQQAAKYIQPLMAAMDANQINTPLRKAHFLAQLGHESASMIYTSEIANGNAYEGRADLGNTQPGDGPLFKGRGLIQITGRNNYTAYGKARNRDFITGDNPKLLATDPNLAADSAGWFWATRNLNALADQDDVLAITKKINGGTNGLDDRKLRLNICKCLLVPELSA
ncbi:MAG TPA: glycoside hydrolase family 19 protein [Candidatus Angelobacter sp.]|nr:glycoside hydrolase family 19 protein [Candidatus Angelobacter sp.]